MPATTRPLTVDVDATGETLTVAYSVGHGPTSTIIARYPSGVMISNAAADFIAASAAAYLGSLVLADSIRILRPLPLGLTAALQPLAVMLYDIRRWKDDLPLSQVPLPAAATRRRKADAAVPLKPRRSALLWSGGKDSTLGLLTLRANGYEAVTLHATLNSGVEQYERAAVARLSVLLEEPVPYTLQYVHADFLVVAGDYAVAWDSFPLSNRVPFGRDLLLAALAVPFALSHSAGLISFGHDGECRTAQVTHQGKVIPRNDCESATGALVLEAALRAYVHPELRLLPPVASLSEFRILHDMFRLRPDLMSAAAFCFWGERCGRCAKCLRYYLADRVFGSGELVFAVDPLSDGACPELLDLLAPTPRSTLFRTQVLAMLGRLVERGLHESTGEALATFRAEHLPQLAPVMDLLEKDLLRSRLDPQVPADFRPLSAWSQMPRAGG